MTRMLRIAVDRPVTCLDMEQPAGFQNEVAADLFQNLYDQLTSPTPYLNDEGVRCINWHGLTAMLAESWSFSADGRDCTFLLRRGVFSHDGHELTADDVVWGWQRAFAVRDVGKWVARVSSVQDETRFEALDRYSVVFHLSDPNPALPRAMAQCTPSVYDTTVVREQVSEEDPWAKQFLAARPAGYGPYRLADLSESEITLVAHDRYWRGRPAIPAVRTTLVEEKAAAIEALLSGDIDLVPGVSIEEAAALHGRTGIRVVSANATPGLVLHIDPTEVPFDNPLVRQAIAHAVPYQDIIQTVYLGGARRWKSWVQPETPGYAPETWPYDENLAMARRLLAEAGFPNGFATRVVVRTGEGAPLAAELLRDSLARIGIALDIEIDRGQGRSLVGAPKANLGPLMLRGSAGKGRGHRVFDPMYGLSHDFGPGRMRLVRYAYENPAFYQALQAIPSAGAGWNDAVREAQRILSQDAVVIPICGYRYYLAHRSNLDGYRWYPDNRLGLFDLSWQG